MPRVRANFFHEWGRIEGWCHQQTGRAAHPAAACEFPLIHRFHSSNSVYVCAVYVDVVDSPCFGVYMHVCVCRLFMAEHKDE